ncbi:metal-dependent hydrolase [Acidovorax sp. GBBC 3334]|uniref:metal-dependent hydrolase n=1 Tax=Acidovorax sp. GBBC 3334 TaxID=2940496 RepID=UPI0023031B95|nr:metal-dependent hydrolase [Acidovorax sp. GBBC 3334]MDA8453294.1 metal-dependent hydrolase [Acidovorax sp. GBBC 3334]
MPLHDANGLFQANAQAHAQAHATLPVRKLAVDLANGFPRRWHGGDAFRTQFFNALSMSFPVGEQFFIDSVRAAQERLDPQRPGHTALRTLVRGFIGQEATHRHIHGLYNAELERQGLDNRWQHRARARIARLHQRTANPLHALAITCAYEHFTALLADGTLRHARWLEGADAQMQTVWRWHAAEETEHRAVAFDLYRALGGSNAWRVRWYLYVGAVFMVDALRQTATNLRSEGSLWRPGTWLSALGFFWGRDGVARRSLPAVLRYLRRDFHPDQEHTAPAAATLAGDWLAANADRLRVVGGNAP